MLDIEELEILQQQKVALKSTEVVDKKHNMLGFRKGCTIQNDFPGELWHQ
jgi:hypothetical protein